MHKQTGGMQELNVSPYPVWREICLAGSIPEQHENMLRHISMSWRKIGAYVNIAAIDVVGLTVLVSLQWSQRHAMVVICSHKKVYSLCV